MMKLKTTFPKTEITIDNMSLYELCRWAALKDAIDLIGDKCEEKKINFDNFDLEPLKIQKYVDSATDVLYNKVLENETIN
jgi:hypothetical protein